MLKVVKKPAYLSPSSLAQYNSQPNNFYLERMAPNPKSREPQTTAGGAGSIFDVLVKVDIAKRLNITAEVFERVIKGAYSHQPNELRGLSFKDAFLNVSVEPQNHHLLSSVEDIARFYLASSIYKNTSFVDIELQRYYSLLSYGATPIFTKPDASVIVGNGSSAVYSMPVPLDWKVTGFSSTSGASPKPGYKNSVDASGQPSGPHSKYKSDMLLSSIDPKWSAQLAAYGWVLGWPVGTPFLCVIHNICIRPTGVRVVLYEGWVSAQEQIELARSYEKCWKEIQTGFYPHQVLLNNRDMVEFMALNETWW